MSEHADAFPVAAGVAATWPTGKGGATAVMANGLTRAGMRCVIKSIYFLNGAGGFVTLLHGDGSTAYFNGIQFAATTAVSLLRDSDIELWDGLAIGGAGLTGSGVIVEYLQSVVPVSP